MKGNTNGTTIMRQYDNPCNGGRELVCRNGNQYFIDSDWGKGFSGDLIPVSRTDMETCLIHTQAPQSVVSAILD